MSLYSAMTGMKSQPVKSEASPAASPAKAASPSTNNSPRSVVPSAIPPAQSASLAASLPADRAAKVNSLMDANRAWAAARLQEDPDFFERLYHQQAPEYLWIGCADSRVPANTIVGLDPGEVFVQRNVGNQAMHTDLNCQACIEYAVTALKVKTIIVCGHYNCGAVKAALSLPSRTPGLVNNWISDIRECRNQHKEDLKGLSPDEQIERLCEYNVMRQTFQVCTSPAVQAAWDAGVELHVHGMCYSLKDGLLRNLVGPISHETDLGTHDPEAFLSKSVLSAANLIASLGTGNVTVTEGADGAYNLQIKPDQAMAGTIATAKNTASMAGKLQQHTSWSKDAEAKAASGAASAANTRPTSAMSTPTK